MAVSKKIISSVLITSGLVTAPWLVAYLCFRYLWAKLFPQPEQAGPAIKNLFSQIDFKLQWIPVAMILLGVIFGLILSQNRKPR